MSSKEKDISKLFGKVIREMRGEHNLTQEKLAELSDLHTNYISLLERGKRKPTIGLFLKLHRHLIWLQIYW